MLSIFGLFFKQKISLLLLLSRLSLMTALKENRGLGRDILTLFFIIIIAIAFASIELNRNIGDGMGC
jgi:hypothetical protein